MVASRAMTRPTRFMFRPSEEVSLHKFDCKQF
jgi:hypothetical protein